VLRGLVLFVQFLKFLLVGILNTTIQYVVFWILLSVAGINYLLASVLGYCLGMINSYVMNRRWTFASKNPQVLSEGMKFIAVNLLALGTNMALLFFLVSLEHFRPQMAQLWAIAGSVAVNFALNRIWTFVPASTQE
jgi:putative flippase GtrA